MTEPTRDDAQRILLENARNWHCHKMVAATDVNFAFGPPGVEGRTRFHAPILLAHHLLPPVDLQSDNIPRDVAQAFRTLAARLKQMAAEVETVAPEPFKLRPNAFITMDADGKVIGQNLTLHRAGELEIAYSEITSETAETMRGSATEYPELMDQYRALSEIANREPEWQPADEDDGAGAVV